MAAAVLINSFGVVLMLHAGAGISAISSVPYAFSLTLGTWTYIFQGVLVLSLMVASTSLSSFIIHFGCILNTSNYFTIS